MLEPRKRPLALPGRTIRYRTGCGNLYVTVTEQDSLPFEVFAQLGKAGNCSTAMLESISRLASLCLRSGIASEQVVKHLQGIGCPNPLWDEKVLNLSCSDCIAKALATPTPIK